MKQTENPPVSISTLRRRVLSLPTLAAVVVAGALLALALVRVFDIDWELLWTNVKSINPVMYLLALVFYYASFWVRGLRWRLIAFTARIDRTGGGRIPGPTKMAAIILMGWFANSVAFLRLGDAYRGWSLSREAGTGFPPSLGTILAERVQDMVAVLLLVLIAAGWVTAFGGVEVPGAVVIAAVALVVLLVAFLGVMQRYGVRMVRRLPRRFRRAYMRFQRGTLYSFRAEDLPVQLGLGITGWMLEIARFYFVAQGLGIEISFGVVMFAALANAMLTTIPTPGGFGFVEGGLTGLLILLGLDDTTALSLTVVDRTISWLSVVIFGGILFFTWNLVKVRSGNTKTASAAPETTAPKESTH